MVFCPSPLPFTCLAVCILLRYFDCQPRISILNQVPDLSAAGDCEQPQLAVAGLPLEELQHRVWVSTFCPFLLRHSGLPLREHQIERPAAADMRTGSA